MPPPPPPPHESPTLHLLPALQHSSSKSSSNALLQQKQNLKSALSGSSGSSSGATGQQQQQQQQQQSKAAVAAAASFLPSPRTTISTPTTPTDRPLPPLFLHHYLPTVPEARPLADPATTELAAVSLLLSPLPPKTAPAGAEVAAEAATDALSAVTAALGSSLAEHVPRFVFGVGAVGAVGGDLTVKKEEGKKRGVFFFFASPPKKKKTFSFTLSLSFSLFLSLSLSFFFFFFPSSPNHPTVCSRGSQGGAHSPGLGEGERRRGLAPLLQSPLPSQEEGEARGRRRSREGSLRGFRGRQRRGRDR